MFLNPPAAMWIIKLDVEPQYANSYARVGLQDIFVSLSVHCVRLGNYRVINSCWVVAKRHDRLHITPWLITICSYNLSDTTGKEALASDYYYCQAVMELNKNNQTC